jgi:monoterpene epsilon-lactone hydrolase
MKHFYNLEVSWERIRMISEEAKKAKDRFKRLGFFIRLISQNPTKLSSFKVRLQRANFNLIVGRLAKKAKGVTYSEIQLGGIRTWKVSAPNSDPEKILLYFHGGAYIVGNPESYYPMMSHLAEATGFTIYVPDYRLAPEHLYPSQLEDGCNTYKSLLEDYGYSPNQIAFGGDSAGGNLALSTLLKLKRRWREFAFICICLSPWADPAATGDSYNLEMCDRDPVLGPTFKRVFSEYGLDSYLTYYVDDKDMDENNPYICPIKGDYTNSPPIMVQVGAHELLLSDSRTLKNVFERDGVTYEYKEWDELWHVFQLEAEMPETIESFKMFGSFLNKYIGVPV